MLKIPPMPDLPPPADRPLWVEKLLAVIVALRELVWHLRRVVVALRDEVAELKKQKKRPVVRPSKLTEGEKRKGRGPRKKSHGPPRPPDRTVVVKAEHVPEGEDRKSDAAGLRVAAWHRSAQVDQRDSDLVKRRRGRVTADRDAPGASPRRG
jgi:hypothetical protein